MNYSPLSGLVPVTSYDEAVTRLKLIVQVRQALGLVIVLLFVAGLLLLVGLVAWLEHYLEADLGYT